MSFEDLLSHRADIQRLRESVNIDSQQEPDSWTAYMQDVPCRVSVPNGVELTNLNVRDLITVTMTLFFEADVAIAETDRITEVRDASGNVLVTDLDIQFVRAVTDGDGITHHLEVPCQVARGPAAWLDRSVLGA